MGRGRTKAPIPALDLSKYANDERLPPNVIAIVKNALVIFNCNTERISKHYKLPKEKIDMIYEENYLQINQLLDAKTKSKELDKGIDNAILLLTDHVNSVQASKTGNLMTKSTITDITKITDRFLNLKSQFNNTYDILVNKMQEHSYKERQLEVLERGKIEDDSEYVENVMTVYTKLKSTVSRKIKATNVLTKEVRHYNSISALASDLGCNGDTVRKRLADKCLHRNEWAFEEE